MAAYLTKPNRVTVSYELTAANVAEVRLVGELPGDARLGEDLARSWGRTGRGRGRFGDRALSPERHKRQAVVLFSALKGTFSIDRTLAERLASLATRIAAKIAAYTYAFYANRLLGRPDEGSVDMKTSRRSSCGKTTRAREGQDEQHFLAGRARLAAPAGRLYTPVALTIRRTHLLAFGVLVTAFVSLYPYLGAMEMCHFGECPYAAQSSTQSSAASTGLGGLCLSAVLAASSAGILAFPMLRGRRLFEERSRPAQFFLSPDPPPPQFS